MKANIVWLPFQLNPGIPDEGLPRAESRKQKFGCVERTPNTRAAHQLIELAQHQEDDPGKGGRAVDALFRAYFDEAKNIGDAAVLEEIACAKGV